MRGAWGWQRAPRHLTVLGSAPLQVPAPLPGGGQGAAPLAHHRWAPRVGRPDGSALAPRPAHGTGGEGPAHQHRSVPPSPIPLIPWVPPGTWALCWALAASGWMGFSSPPPVSGAFGPSKVLGCGWGTRGTHHLCFRASSPPLGLCPQCSSPLGVPREQSEALPCSSWLLHVSGGFRDSSRGVGAGSR